jgi:2Fe-2S ferredoxin
MSGETIKVTFIEGDQEKIIDAPIGLSILEIAHHNDIDLEGACEGSLACATCHVILEEKIYNNLEEPKEEEEDMLDLAFGLTHTSRLGCQIIMSKELNGMRIIVPSATRNINM